MIEPFDKVKNDIKFDFEKCCKELGVNSKWLKASSYVRDEGISGMLMDSLWIPFTSITIGGQMEYMDIFETMLEDGARVESAYEDIVDSSKKLNAGFEVIEMIDDVDNLPDELQLLNASGKAFGIMEDAFGYATYVRMLNQNNKERLMWLKALSGNRYNYDYPESMVAAAMEVYSLYDEKKTSDDYINKFIYSISDNLVEYGVDIAIGKGVVENVLTLCGLDELVKPDWTEGINYVSKYNKLAQSGIDVYEENKIVTHIGNIEKQRAHAMFYLYGSEYNWETMAQYAEDKGKKELSKKYLEKAELALEWQGKFLASSGSTENDSHEYKGERNVKWDYVEELRGVFASLEQAGENVTTESETTTTQKPTTRPETSETVTEPTTIQPPTTSTSTSNDGSLKEQLINAAYKLITEKREYEDSLLFIDINMDGVAELLLTGAGQNGFTGYLYKYINGEYVKTNIKTTWDNDVYAYTKENKIIIVNKYNSWADEHTVFADYDNGNILTEVWPHKDFSYDYVSDILAYYQDEQEITESEYNSVFSKYLDGSEALGKCPCSTMTHNITMGDLYTNIKEVYESMEAVESSYNLLNKNISLLNQHERDVYKYFELYDIGDMHKLSYENEAGLVVYDPESMKNIMLTAPDTISYIRGYTEELEKIYGDDYQIQYDILNSYNINDIVIEQIETDLKNLGKALEKSSIQEIKESATEYESLQITQAYNLKIECEIKGGLGNLNFTMTDIIVAEINGEWKMIRENAKGTYRSDIIDTIELYYMDR